MKSVVIYTSRHGNTRRIAEAIADELNAHGSASAVAADDAYATVPPDVDLIVVGGPTEGHHMTPQMAAFLDRLDGSSIRGKTAAAFDTRLHGPRWLWGSAAAGIGERLREAGAIVTVPPESFYVTGPAGNKDGVPDLSPGEADRARAWAAAVGTSVRVAA